VTSRSIARWFIKKAVVLSLVLLGIFFTSTQTVVAQSPIQYTNYVNLFKGTDPNPSLTLYSLFKQNTTTPEVGFNLQMSFSGIPTTDPGPAKTAAWAQITDFDDSNYVFVLRICDIADTTKTNCLFSTIPHKKVPANASNTDLSSIFSAILGTAPSLPTNLPQSTTQPTGSIFHYQYTSILSPDMQNNKFNVLFPVTSLFGINPNTGGILSNNITDFVRIGDPRTFQADAWYCAQGSNLPTQNNSSNPNYNMFGGLCGGNRPYFKIATSATFRMPQSVAEAQSQTPGTITPVDTTPTESNIPGCGLINGSVMGCVAQIAYYLIYRPIAWFAGLMGTLFDFFLGYSLSDESYRAAFAVRGWEIVRDICNIFFIIILVYVGLATVFNTSSFSPKKVLSTLIINALLINFSLFVTRVAIDVSNVVARVFYNSIEVCSGTCVDENSDGTPDNLKPGISGYTPLSEKIVSSFNPQKIFDMKVLSAATALPDNGTTTASGRARTLTTDDNEYAAYYLVVSLIAAMILFAIAMMFWKTAFFFLGRVIGLYMAMIFAPFAFLSYGNVPLVNKIKKLSWQNWSGDLVKYATLAPIFVFFLYVIYSFIDTDFMKFGQATAATSALSFFETVVYIAIPMLIVYFMVNQGVKLAEEYAGDFGKQVQGFAQKATGFVGGAALGVATGGAALAGRNVLGRLGTRIAESGRLQNTSARGGIMGRLADRTMRIGSGMSRATYDARNTSLPSTLQRATGVGITNSGVGRILGTNTNRTAGGFREAITRNERVLTERASRFQVTGQQARNMDTVNEAWERAYQARRTTAQNAALSAGRVFNEAQFRFSDMRAQAALGNARPRSATETNRRRERAYQASLARGTILSQIAERTTNRLTTPVVAGGVGLTAAGASIVTGGALVGASALVGQGAIQGAARQNVIAARRNQSRPTVSGGQRTRMLNQLAQLQRDQLRVYTNLSPVVTFGGLPVTPANVNSLSVIDVQNYQAANPNHGMASPNTVIAERNRINTDIASVRTQLGI
jgi:hypothetical protein